MNALHHWAHIAVAIGLAAFRDKLHIDPKHLHVVNALQALSMLLAEFPGLKAKLQGFLGQAQKAAACLLLLSLASCALSPAQIEADTALGTNLGLSGAVIFDKAKAVEIQADATQVAQAINQAVIPTFQPGATSSGLLNSAVSQAMLHLQGRLQALKHGPEILGAIALIQGPLSSALGMTASPTALLSPAAQMNALAFFSGVSQGIATFTGNASLAPPPLPTALVAPVVPPAAPAPASVPK